MKKLALIAFASVALSGCQTTGSSSDIASTDFQDMSCDEIKQTFDEYHTQMDNLDTGASVLSAVGVDAGADEAQSMMREGYSRAKTVATPVLKAKNCSVTI